MKIYPKKLNYGGTFGIFTPSTPVYSWAVERYEHALKVITDLGFSVKEGSLTASRKSEGYRSGSPEERASELMGLICDPEVDICMSSIGGFNTASMIPFLDFERIKKERKIICGYSDLTSLHLAVRHYSNLVTFYGPAIVPTFGEYPVILPETFQSFVDMLINETVYPYTLTQPKKWSNHRREWCNEEWKTGERKYSEADKWKILRSGIGRGESLVCNLDTLCSNAGVDYFPTTEQVVLFLEQETTSLAIEERQMNQLKLIGALDNLSGLVISKAEDLKDRGQVYRHEELIMDFLPSHTSYPVIYNFDCGHTHPMITMPIGVDVELSALTEPQVSLLDNPVRLQ